MRRLESVSSPFPFEEVASGWCARVGVRGGARLGSPALVIARGPRSRSSPSLPSASWAPAAASASVRPLWLLWPRSLGFSPCVPWRLSAPIRSAAHPRPTGAGLGRGRSPALASAPPAPGPPPMGPG